MTDDGREPRMDYARHPGLTMDNLPIIGAPAPPAESAMPPNRDTGDP